MRTIGDVIKIKAVAKQLRLLRDLGIITLDEYDEILDILYRA